ncbi:MAG TPA: branched-chain amino acid aminotransferase [Streptosporangiaceae bacterium]|jgi:branched-chain amino acid aminotransferase
MTPSQDTAIGFDIRPASQPVPAARREQLMAVPGFGSVFTDHMVSIDWSAGRGWHDGRLEPYGPITLDPAAAVLHYGQEIFEGLKAYRQPGGAIAAFRLDANAARFSRSAARMAMPALPGAAFTEAVRLLVSQDRDWVPAAEGQSLYLRPFMIATQVGLGVNRPSAQYRFTVIGSPVAAYFNDGVQPVSVWLSEEYTRAAPGGTGTAKCGGNYAGAFAGQLEAQRNGCDQVVWLDATGHSVVEEMGGMNLFFVYGSGPDARMVTPALTGTLLPGVTRDSLLKLGPDLGIPAAEGTVTVADWQAGCRAGEITEVFACGTAAVITPVGTIRGKGREWAVGDGSPGPVTRRLRAELLGIQHGSRPDPYGWMQRLC